MDRLITLGIVLSITLNASISFADAPPAGTAGIRGFSFAGPGCPQGTVDADISEDMQAVTIAFSQMNVEVPANRPNPRASVATNCTVKLAMTIPVGWTFRMKTIETRGYLDLPSASTSAMIGPIQYGSQDRPDLGDRMFRVGREAFTGPLASDFTNIIQVPSQIANLRKCRRNTDYNLLIIPQIQVTSLKAGEGALMTVDTVDSELIQTIAIDWKRCV